MNNMYQMIFFLIVGSFAGYLLETVWYRMLRGRWVCRKGVVLGPFSPLYGVAFACFVAMEYIFHIEATWKKFVIGACLGSAYEYLASVMQEKILGTKSWDYSRHRFNLNGRISLKFMLIWGVVAVFILEYIEPACLAMLDRYFVSSWMKGALTAAGILFLLDCLVSVFACLRQKFRREGREASNRLEIWLDKRYPDEKLEKIFTEIRWV